MFEVMDVLKIGNKLSVTLQGKCEDIKNGSKLKDGKGNIYNVVSVGMTRYNNPTDIEKSTSILITPCTLLKGEQLYKSE
mgnify:CR=1 FL=1